MDLNTSKQVGPKVVIVRYQTEGRANDGYENNAHMLYGTKGPQTPSGEALIFQDGKVTKGTWNKKSRIARETFLDAAGKEIELNRGQIWLQTVPKGTAAVY